VFFVFFLVLFMMTINYLSTPPTTSTYHETLKKLERTALKKIASDSISSRTSLHYQ
jgi:hypothetical protein